MMRGICWSFLIVGWLNVWLNVAAAGTAPDPALVAFDDVALPDVAAVDTLELGLGAAIRLALEVSEEVQLAEAQLRRAKSLVVQSRAQALPQLNAGLTYTRQIASVFETGDLEFPAFEPDTLAPLEQRVRDLEENLPAAAAAGLGQLFGDLPFGREHNWVASLSLTQKLYQGGALVGAIRAAGHVRTAAAEALADAKADLVQEVMEAYLGALLAERMVAIAELGLDQATRQHEHVRLRHAVGKASDFDLLQAEVQRDNQKPPLVEAQNGRSLAYLNLRRLINLSARKPLLLSDTLLAENAPVPDLTILDREAVAAAADHRPAIRVVEETVAARERGLQVAKGARLPEVSLFADYSQQAFPPDLFPDRDDWVEDFAVGLRVNVALFDGFLNRGRVNEARAQLKTEEQRLAILREGRRLAVEQRIGELERAHADLMSRQQTVRYARRVHELAILRFEEGAANLFDVADVRITEQLARINEARARYDMLLALARLEKLSGRAFLTDLIRPRSEEEP